MADRGALRGGKFGFIPFRRSARDRPIKARGDTVTTPDDSFAPRSAEPSWQQRWASASSLIQALTDPDYGVEDLMVLSGAHTPAWIDQLLIPPHWQRLDLPETEVRVAPERVLVRGPHIGGGWEATDTLEVYGYTSRPALSVVLGSTTRTLRDLDATDLTTRVLAIPATVGLAAERSTATLTIEGRRIWTQLTHYVAGSDEPLAGRLIVHSLHADTDRLPAYGDDLAVLTRTVQDAFTAMFATPGDGNG
jgi:hypothetical protein